MLCVAVPACASGDGDGSVTFGPGLGGATTRAEPPWWTDGPPPDSTGDEDTGGKEDDPGLPPDLGSCTGPADCVIDNSTCFLSQGACVDGSCEFEPKAPTSACDDGDPCTERDACDGVGLCVGMPKQCAGGECVMGMCTGGECEPGTADCNGDATDGCETLLGTNSDCAGCGDRCDAGDHASGSCALSACTYDCDLGFGNCDEDWTNGCEIPLGANQCDAGGLNPNGCWTSHCGSSADADAVNFGTWFCYDCTTCDVPAAGQCRWCNHDTGQWFPAEACACGDYEGLACGP